MKEFALSHPFILALALNNYDPFLNPGKVGILSESAYDQVFAYLKTNPPQGVLVLTGGEPFVDLRLKEILSLARSMRWPVSVDTWGGFLEQPSSLNLIQQIRLRLFSLNPEKHDQIAGEKDNFQKIMVFARWLAENYNQEKILVFPVCRENTEEIADILSWCAKHNFKANIFIVPRHHKYALEFTSFQQIIKKLGNLPLRELIIDIPLLGLSGFPNLCPGGRLAMFIGPEGEVKPCPYFPLPLSHLKEGVLKAWVCLQAKLTELNKGCACCRYFSLCGGGCLANKTGAGKDYYCPLQ
ncbi:MAG: radical SAM protein [Firmicutes bacterium]|nr:radical SAM protein [Bacillota bacterium]